MKATSLRTYSPSAPMRRFLSRLLPFDPMGRPRKCPAASGCVFVAATDMATMTAASWWLYATPAIFQPHVAEKPPEIDSPSSKYRQIQHIALGTPFVL